MVQKNPAHYLDLANHRPDSTLADIELLCQEVAHYGFNSAFLNPCHVRYARDYAQAIIKKKIKIGTVVAFPIGQETLSVKITAAKAAVEDGAEEIDVSTDIGLLKNDQINDYFEELRRIVDAVKGENKETVVKFIIETGFLKETEIKKASELVLQSKADFVKTCSGWGPRGAELRDLALIKEAVGDKIKIKVAGGIHTYQRAMKFIEQGASRIGTSKAVEIIKGAK